MHYTTKCTVEDLLSHSLLVRHSVIRDLVELEEE